MIIIGSKQMNIFKEMFVQIKIILNIGGCELSHEANTWQILKKEKERH